MAPGPRQLSAAGRRRRRSPDIATAVRKVLKTVTGLVGVSTRVVDICNVDTQLVRIQIGCATSPRLGDVGVIAAVERQLVDLLPGRWHAGWHLAAGALLLTRNP